MYLTIKRKTCRIDGCTKYPGFGMAGFCYIHTPEEIKEKKAKQRQDTIKRANARKSESGKLRKLARETGVDKELELWFIARRHECTGFCCNCGAKSYKDNEERWKWSIAHIAPKALCPATATHYLNFLELCHQCHQDFDSTFTKAANMNCFHEARHKFDFFKDLLPPEQFRKINPALYQ